MGCLISINPRTRTVLDIFISYVVSMCIRFIPLVSLVVILIIITRAILPLISVVSWIIIIVLTIIFKTSGLIECVLVLFISSPTVLYIIFIDFSSEFFMVPFAIFCKSAIMIIIVTHFIVTAIANSIIFALPRISPVMIFFVVIICYSSGYGRIKISHFKVSFILPIFSTSFSLFLISSELFLMNMVCMLS